VLYYKSKQHATLLGDKGKWHVILLPGKDKWHVMLFICASTINQVTFMVFH